jgi:hypothetical protein
MRASGPVAARLDVDLHVVLGEVFGRQFGEAFVVFDKEYACIHAAILTAGAAAVHPVAVDGRRRAYLKKDRSACARLRCGAAHALECRTRHNFEEFHVFRCF